MEMKSVNVNLFASFLAKKFDLDKEEVLKSVDEFFDAKPSGVFLITDYSDRAAAFFGETKPFYEKLKELNEEKKKVVTFNSKLKFGPGLIVPKKYVKDATQCLDENKMKYKKRTTAEYEKELSGEKSGETSEKEKKVTKSSKKETKEKDTQDASTEPVPLKIKKNKWGNYEDKGIVFVKLPVGEDGEILPVAIGVQNTKASSSKQGFQSIEKMDEKTMEKCKKDKFRLLTNKMYKNLKNNDEEKYEEIKEWLED